MLVDIDKVIVKDRIRKDFGDIKDLSIDIKENGLINPPVVSPDFSLIAGERRLRACKELRWQQIEIRVMSVRDYEHQLKIEISENEKRKQFTFSEGMDFAQRLEQVERLKAKENMSKGGQGLQEFANLNTNEIVADIAGFGNKETYRQAKFVANNANDEMIANLDEKTISINKAYKQLMAKKEKPSNS